MGKVLKADGSAADASVEIDLGSDQSVIWLTYRVFFDADTFAIMNLNFPSVDGTYTAGHGTQLDLLKPADQWYSGYGSGGVPTADAWTLVEHHWENGGPANLYIDGSLVITSVDGGGSDVRFVKLGVFDGSTPPNGIVYFDDVKVGTTRGASDLFGDDFEDGTLDAWTTLDGAVSVVDDPAGPVTMPMQRVGIALDDTAFEWEPEWTYLDATENLVSGIDIRRGRQTEYDVTETSTATVFLNDRAGLFDPDNTDSPYFGKVDGKQIKLSLWDPVAGEMVQQWRGHIDSTTFDFHGATNADGEPILATIGLECVGIFEYLAGVEMIPGLFGDIAPAGSEGVVFYEDGPAQTRAQQLLADGFGDPVVAADWSVVFTLNVDVQETRYDPGDSILPALRDVADAEAPTIANVYEDKLGRVAIHGRFAQLDPEGTEASATPGAWNFTRWKAGDGVAVVADDERAQIRPPLRWARPRTRIINAAMSYPRGIDEADIPGQVVLDTDYDAGSTSRTEDFGYRSWSANDLITLAGTTTGNTANEECRLFSLHQVANNYLMKTRVEAVTFKSIRPDDSRAAATWALICGVDIGDALNLEHGYPGGTTHNDDYFVQGSEMSIRPLNPDHDMVELTVNISPAPTVDVFTP